MYPTRNLIHKFRIHMLAELREVPINHNVNHHLYHVNLSQELNELNFFGVI